MANLVLAFLEVGLGAIILDAGIKGDTLTAVVKGQATQNPISGLSGTAPAVGTALASSGTTAGASGAKSSPIGSLPSGGASNGLVTMAALAAVGAKHGWSGQQITDWMSLSRSESNGTLSDTNPSSGAYGIAQFINGAGEYATYGGNSTTLEGQLVGMANYIAQRYGDPSKAWAFHQSNNYY